jgi:N-methylhydantoinase B
MGVIAGDDKRFGDSRPFVNMVFFGLSTGPALHGHDGWITYEGPNGGGVLALDQIEIDEMTYPILVEERKIACDAMGMGQWNGGPAMQGRYRTVSGDLSVSYCSDGDINPPRGVLGGLNGTTALNAKIDAAGDLIMLPGFRMETIKPEETVVFRTVSGGGYGDPLERDPERVARDADKCWISEKTARDIYGVSLRLAANGLDHEVDQAATREMRDRRRSGISA